PPGRPGGPPGCPTQKGRGAYKVFGRPEPPRPRFLALLLVLDLHEPPFADCARERRDELFLPAVRIGLGRLADVELSEGLLELAAHALERRVRLCRDHRADEVERERDRARLERRQARRRAERVAVELPVDAHVVALE